jgi:predicted negative regulator of RcsB-dependent stress response
MAENETEEQQIDALKEWWKQNGSAAVIGVVLGVGSLVGWKGWGAYQEQQYMMASDRYDVMQQSIVAQDIDAVMLQAKQLKQDFSATPYAALAGLMLAKVHAENVEYDKTIENLQWVIDNAKQDTIQSIAKLRLIRIYIVQNQLDQAQALLNHDYPLAYASLKEELRGDWHVSRGEFEEARAAYDSAIATAEESEISYLQMKRDNAMATQQSNV